MKRYPLYVIVIQYRFEQPAYRFEQPAHAITQVYPLSRTLSVHQSQQRYSLPPFLELAGHLVGRNASKTLPNQKIRAERLNYPDCLYVICRHLLHSPVRFRLSVRAPCPKPMERIIRTNMASQVGVNEKLRLATASPRKKEDRCLASTRLQFDKIRGFFFYCRELRFG